MRNCGQIPEMAQQLLQSLRLVFNATSARRNSDTQEKAVAFRWAAGLVPSPSAGQDSSFATLTTAHVFMAGSRVDRYQGWSDYHLGNGGPRDRPHPSQFLCRDRAALRRSGKACGVPIAGRRDGPETAKWTVSGLLPMASAKQMAVMFVLLVMVMCRPLVQMSGRHGQSITLR